MSKIDFTDEQLGQLWDKMNWPLLEKRLAEMQAKLTQAALDRDQNRVIRLQRKISDDRDNRCLAVRHVTASNSGPGVDGVRWRTSVDKMKAALALNVKGYQATPVRRILVTSKHGGKERRFGIPTYYDRAMCVLYSYTLLPVTEATADQMSFAFRPGRSAQDLQAYIIEALTGEDAPSIIVRCDVKSCWASIYHDWLIKHVPMEKWVLKEFLRAGYVFAGELFPSSDAGISEASNLSPYLGNFVLDGLQRFIYKQVFGTENPPDYANGQMFRFADDFIVTVRRWSEAYRVQSAVERFLANRGLKLSEEKSTICTIDEGFTFLSQTYKRKKGMVFFYPSDKAVARFVTEMRETILTSNKSQRDLIVLVNQKLRGWANYHRFSDAREAFHGVDVAVQTALLEAAVKKHPKLAKAKVIAKYWYDEGNDRHCYALPEDKSVRVIRLEDTLLVHHDKVRADFNPFLEWEYLQKRTHEREIRNVSGKYHAIWKRQGGKCYYCGFPILIDQPRTVVPIKMKRAPTPKNSAYVHQVCAQDTFEMLRLDEMELLHPYRVYAALDDMEIAAELQGKRGKQTITEDWRHYPLKRYFAESTAASITLTFKQLEEIDGTPLPEAARSRANFWHPRSNANTIAEAWIQEGYRLEKLDMNKKKVTFKREADHISQLEIPKALLGKIPDDAVFELERHMDYIIKKYGL